MAWDWVTTDRCSLRRKEADRHNGGPDKEAEPIETKGPECAQRGTNETESAAGLGFSVPLFGRKGGV